MSYCIAFSIDGATDVTRRYIRNATTHGLERNKCPEEVLLFITKEIKQIRRGAMLKDERKRLIIEDEREDKELRGYVIQNLAAEIGRMIPVGASANAAPPSAGDEQKLPARRSGAQAWREARGEDGAQEHDRSPREGH